MERTIWEKITGSTIAILKLIGIVIVLVVAGKLLYDFAGAKETIQTHLKKVRKLNWKKAEDDPEKETIKEPLTDEEVEHELKKISSETSD